MKRRGIMRKCAGALLAAMVLTMPGSVAFAGTSDVDGYYDDWEGIPKTQIGNFTYGSHNGQEVHEGALVMDDDYLYAYVSMDELYQSQIPVNEYYLSVNGKEIAFNILGKGSDGTVDWSKNVYNLDEGTHKDEVGVFVRDNATTAVGDAVVTVIKDTTAEENDKMELRISIEMLEQLYGLPAGALRNGAHVEFRNPNLGSQKVELVGTSSGAVIGTIICVSSVGLALGLFKKRKRIFV